jgi:DNA-binding NarL/FixJ family response regulator
MPLLILVADDNLGTRVSVSDYLQIAGYSVIMAEDGQEALSLVEEYRPHLIVTDITMPRLDGYELVRKVRQQPIFRLLPVIFLTERASTEERILGYQLGCDFYLPKPFEMHELGAMVRNLLERSQMIQSEWQLRLPSLPLEDQHLDNNQNLTLPSTPDSFHLTNREQEVLNLLTMGLSNAEIGHHLHLSPRTVEKYVTSLLRKTDTSNRAELVRFALEHHLVQ